ncbi:MAG TPA: hypothetical protein VG893_04580 [Terracidiphilus sp.]|nr:hypothetical protein [Terracidiphilus sp.]
MDSDDPLAPAQLDALSRVFADQLMACLEECARGRRGLFSDLTVTGEDESERAWPEAARLRELAFALQALLNQDGERNALCDEFLDLCTMHGESHPGEPRLARAFLARIERGEVGTPTEPEYKPLEHKPQEREL